MKQKQNGIKQIIASANNLCSMKNIILVIIAAFVLGGCSRYAQKEAVYIPAKCDIQMPAKPYPRDNQSTAQRVGEILIYTEQLESGLKFCTQETK